MRYLLQVIPNAFYATGCGKLIIKEQFWERGQSNCDFCKEFMALITCHEFMFMVLCATEKSEGITMTSEKRS